MTYSTIAAIALATLVVMAGAAAAMPGATPDRAGAHGNVQAADHRPDDAGDEHDGNHSDADENATPVATDADGHGPSIPADPGRIVTGPANDSSEDRARGPPSELPEQVPDHVREIHRLIRDFLGGDLDSLLGEAVSEVTPDGNASVPH